MRKQAALTLFLMLAHYAWLDAQDIRFSQHYLQLPASNPANILMHNTFIAGSFRQQWPSAPFQSKAVSAQAGANIPSVKSGVGLSIYNEQLGGGLQNFTSLNAIYARKVTISKKIHFIPAMQAGIIQKQVDTDELQFAVPENVALMSEIRPDFGLGMKLTYNNVFMAGLYVEHLLEPTFGHSGLNKVHKTVAIDLIYDYYIIKKSFTRKPLFIRSTVNYFLQGTSSYMVIGAGIDRYPLYLGVVSRSSHNVIPQAIGLSAGFSTTFGKVVYTYDTGLLTQQNHISKFGNHEVTFLVESAYKRKTNRHKAIKCP